MQRYICNPKKKKKMQRYKGFNARDMSIIKATWQKQTDSWCGRGS